MAHNALEEFSMRWRRELRYAFLEYLPPGVWINEKIA
jgi:hypothetical protein